LINSHRVGTTSIGVIIALLPVLLPVSARAAMPAEPAAHDRSPHGAAVVTRAAAGLAADQVAIASWRFSVACALPADSLTSATLGGPLQLSTVVSQPDCLVPAVHPPSTPSDQAAVSTGTPQAGRNDALPSAFPPDSSNTSNTSDTDLRAPAVAAPSASTSVPDAAGCGQSWFCAPGPGSTAEPPEVRPAPPREPHTRLVSAASTSLWVHRLPWLGLWLLLWLALTGLFGLAAWVFYKRRLAPEARLVRAAEAGLRRGEFRLEYQPVMSLRDGRCVGVEAMIRWNNAEHGSRGPAYYMSLLEKTRVIGRLTRFVLSSAAEELAKPTAGSALYIGVNVCATYVESKSFASEVSRSAKAIRSRLVLNMPQRGCASPTAEVLHAIAKLRAKGVRFALAHVDEVPADPARLEAFGFEQVKIDRHIMTLDEDERRQRLTAVVRAVGASGASVVAEGVESARHHAVVSQAGVDLGQGFFYGRAMTRSLLLTFLEAGGVSLRMRKKGRRTYR